eukprot:UN24148
MNVNFGYQQDKIDNVFYKLLKRSHTFFNKELNIKNIKFLLNKKKLEEEYETKILKDFKEEIGTCIDDMIDWALERMGNQTKQVGQSLMSHFQNHENIKQSVSAQFSLKRRDLVTRVQTESEKALESYDN